MHVCPIELLRQHWMNAIQAGGDLSLKYLHNLIDGIEVDGREVRLLSRRNAQTASPEHASESTR